MARGQLLLSSMALPQLFVCKDGSIPHLLPQLLHGSGTTGPHLGRCGRLLALVPGLPPPRVILHWERLVLD